MTRLDIIERIALPQGAALLVVRAPGEVEPHFYIEHPRVLGYRRITADTMRAIAREADRIVVDEAIDEIARALGLVS